MFKSEPVLQLNKLLLFRFDLELLGGRIETWADFDLAKFLGKVADVNVWLRLTFEYASIERLYFCKFA